jgi:hypothetical protein
VLLFKSNWSRVRVAEDCFLSAPDADEDCTPRDIIDALRVMDEAIEGVLASFNVEFASIAAFLSAISLAASSLFKIHIECNYYGAEHEQTRYKHRDLHRVCAYNCSAMQLQH